MGRRSVGTAPREGAGAAAGDKGGGDRVLGTSTCAHRTCCKLGNPQCVSQVPAGAGGVDARWGAGGRGGVP
jgi:hypothetical protein